MKNLYIFFLLLVLIRGFGQIVPGVDIKLSPDGVLENVFDHYGNKYSLSEIKAGADVTIDNTLLRSTVLCSSGIFDLYFETGSGMESTSNSIEIQRRTVICQVFNDLSNFIISPIQNAGNTTRVRIWVRNIANIPSVPSGALGLATAFYNIPQNNTVGFGGIADNEVWKTITAGKDSYINVTAPLVSSNSTPNPSGNFYHGMMAFNFSGITWNTNLNIDAPIGQYDLYSVVLHEVTHALGFVSLMNGNGQSVFGGGFNYFSRYDTFLKNNAETQSLITNGTACSTMYNYNFNSSLATSILHPSSSCLTDQTTCSTALKFVGTSTVPIYTTNCFEPGSSLSHFEDLCIAPNVNNAYFVMSNAISDGTQPNSVNTKRFLKFQERNTLGDIGYKLNTTYGNNTTVFGSFNNYGGAVTNGINVAGINDGINTNGTFTYIGNTNTDITINSTSDVTRRLLANDTNATGFECLQDVLSTGFLSATSGNLTTNVTFTSSVAGLHILRYVPINSTGQKGNITYVYVYVNELNNCVAPTSCNLVLNGDFEQYSFLPTNQAEISKACGWSRANLGTPDYYHTLSIDQNVPCNIYGHEKDKIIGNKAYAGFGSSSYNNGLIITEIMKTKLISPLIPNSNYQLSFDVSLAEGVSAFKLNLQAYIGNDIMQTNTGYIPITNANMLFTNSITTNVSNGWKKITFIINTGNVSGEQFLFLGGLSNTLGNISTPNLDVYAGSNYMNFTTPFYTNVGKDSYYYVDNVELIPLSDSVLNLPTSICNNITINNLSEFVELAPLNGVFTGTGVINNSGIYSFEATVAGVGSHIITYTYTNSSGCSVSISDTIIVTNVSGITPTFNPIASICSGAPLTTLSTTSTNSITGTWSPELNNAATTTYTFTPDASQCATITSLTIVVNPSVTPTFDSINSICSGTVLNALPTTSLNGIVGTWEPALNNTETTTYTFTPDAGQCATDASLTITVLPASDPICNDCLPNLTLSTPEVNTTIVYKRQNWIETNGSYVINNTQNITMRAGNYINLKPNTHIVNGSVFHAKIEDCSIIPRVSVNSKNVLNNSKLSEEKRIDIDLESIMVYPNPTDNLVTISGLSMKVKSIFINSMEGKIIHLSNPVKDISYVLDLSNYQKGIYMIRIETIDGKIIIRKLIKN